MTTDPAPIVNTDAWLSWIEIDIEAIRHNFRIFRSLVPPTTAMFAVVKADAYGHGAIPVARALAQEGAEVLCVARVEEALELRGAGIATPLLVFAPPFGPQALAVAGQNIALTISSVEHLAAVSQAVAGTGADIPVHIKVDVGMGRLGIKPEDALTFAQVTTGRSGIILAGVMTHFPCADQGRGETTLQQLETFKEVRQAFHEAGIFPRYFHCANSAATLDFPESHLDAIRPGISLYGLMPSPDVIAQPDLRPAMAMRTRITLLKEVPTATPLSYGGTFVTKGPSRIATVPAGYADGYPRHASSRAVALLHGQRVPQVGRVCMDQILFDVTNVERVSVGDIITLFGEDEGNFLSAEELAVAGGTIGYEITTRIGKRLPRHVVG
ncbi:alanine racemase [candidate division BRC1 bacterium HGW-BRC1-1]|jgi:alanine racemase|nr:MAG: alanine racemase [candidate division BRC1 bacterium HGW-BRC1-1]